MDPLPLLLEWCSTHGLWIDDRLRLLRSEEGGSVYVGSVEHVSQVDTLVKIPRAAILSRRTSAAADMLGPMSDVHSREALLQLALAVHVELMLGTRSRWWGYLQSLPGARPMLAVFWGHERAVRQVGCDGASVPGSPSSMDALVLRDDAAASTWAERTEIWKEIHSAEGSTIPYEVIRDFYKSEAAALLQRVEQPDEGSAATFEGFCYAYTMASSRAFVVDAYHGPCMVPIADAFNHTQENHVHMETDFDVCTTCGAADECEHDALDDDALAPGMRTGTLDDEIEMVTASAITTGEEVFNTYGATLSNAQLLARYGFALDGNEHDCVTWSLSDLYSVFGVSAEDARTLGGIFTMLLSRWPGADCWDASDTVYNDRGAVGDVYTSRAGAPCLAVEADGRVSHGLWAWAACRALVARGIDTPRVVELASAMSEAHVRIEELASAMDDDPKETDHTAQPSEVDQYVLDVCGTIVECVRARKEWVSRGNSMGKLGAMIDALTVESPRTRMALTQVVAEISLLEACEARYTQLVDYIGSSFASV